MTGLFNENLIKHRERIKEIQYFNHLLLTVGSPFKSNQICYCKLSQLVDVLDTLHGPVEGCE